MKGRHRGRVDFRSMSRAATSMRGRPAATTHAEIEQGAFRLFETHGFEATTLEAIAREIGVSRRTLARYYPSKNDIPWGQFDLTLEHFARLLAAIPTDVPVWKAVHQGVIAFNDFPPDADPSHRDRMRLILRTPALQAHSVHKYAAWRQVIADYVATRVGGRSTDLLPQTVAHMSLALAVAAYEIWLDDPHADLSTLLSRTTDSVRTYFQG